MGLRLGSAPKTLAGGAHSALQIPRCIWGSAFRQERKKIKKTGRGSGRAREEGAVCVDILHHTLQNPQKQNPV